jgi:hypothetical protein
MRAEMESAQDPGVAKIRALLLAARTDVAGDVRELSAAAHRRTAPTPSTVPDRSAAIERMRKKIELLRAKVESTTVAGPNAVGARELTVRALLETDQALAKLAATYAAPDQASATALISESVKLTARAKATSGQAGKALGIPWPLQ